MAKKNGSSAASTAIIPIERINPGALAKMEDWEITLAEKTKNEVATEVLGVPRITHKGGLLKIDGNKVEGNKLNIVIVAYGLSKTFYEGEYDPNAEGQTPDCYAFGSAEPGAEGKMTPHEQAPNKVCDSCAACAHNRFGTAKKGNGKRCSDKRRVLCIVEVKDEDSIQKAQVRQFEIPPGSLRNWGNYLKGLKEVTASGNVRTVVTEFSAEPGEKGAHVLTFKPVGRLSKDLALAALAKGQEVETDLFAPFPTIQKTEAPKRSAKASAKVRGK
jgi:hypothetical protein